MNRSKPVPKDIDEYIQGFPKPVQQRLQVIRALVHKNAPPATEVIRYGMPTFLWHGHLVLFAAFQKHIGLFSVPTGHKDFIDDLAGYKTGKGSLQLPHDKPLPEKLIARIIRFNYEHSLSSSAKEKRSGK